MCSSADGYVRELGRTLGRLTLQPERERVSLRELGILKRRCGCWRARASGWSSRPSTAGGERPAPARPPDVEAACPRFAPVRARALKYAASNPSLADQLHITELVNDPDPIVRLTALRVRCASGGSRPLAALASILTPKILNCVPPRSPAWWSRCARTSYHGFAR